MEKFKKINGYVTLVTLFISIVYTLMKIYQSSKPIQTYYERSVPPPSLLSYIFETIVLVFVLSFILWILTSLVLFIRNNKNSK